MMAPVPYPASTYSEIHTGTFSPVRGFVAYEPVNTPVTFLASIILSRSVFFFAIARYSSTASFCSATVSFSTHSLSGASTMNVTPKTVSARVVKMVMSYSSVPFETLKTISAPWLFPIQLRCMSLRESVQSRSSRSSRRRPAYAETRSCHWVIFFCSTGWPPRTEYPSFTSSFASTVPRAGHQFTAVSPW